MAPDQEIGPCVAHHRTGDWRREGKGIEFGVEAASFYKRGAYAWGQKHVRHFRSPKLTTASARGRRWRSVV